MPEKVVELKMVLYWNIFLQVNAYIVSKMICDM